jgi:signal recognition particle subunit SRP54
MEVVSKRIARGSGNSIQDVNRLIKQFGEMQKMIKMFKGKGGKRIDEECKKFEI